MDDKLIVPFGYDLCVLDGCPMAANCLRQVAMQKVDDLRLNVLNPRILPTTGECPHYAKAEKVRYAKGFKGVMGKLPYNLHKRAVTALIGAFSERTYYRIRKGDRLLTPDEQLVVRRILSRLGFTEQWEFDAYVEDYLWGL